MCISCARAWKQWTWLRIFAVASTSDPLRDAPGARSSFPERGMAGAPGQFTAAHQPECEVWKDKDGRQPKPLLGCACLQSGSPAANEAARWRLRRSTHIGGIATDARRAQRRGRHARRQLAHSVYRCSLRRQQARSKRSPCMPPQRDGDYADPHTSEEWPRIMTRRRGRRARRQPASQ